ncbi:MAG TPA: beta-galactosidase [Verrucomicrobiae bacterium]|jgi:beta-galactosidase
MKMIQSLVRRGYACWLLLLLGGMTASADTFTISTNNFLLNGKPFLIKAGEIHPARVPHEYWADRLRMMHAMGLNTVSIYAFWNQFEPREGEFNFTGDADIAEFVRLAQKEGLWVVLRPGPYVCAEWEFGGFPWWLLKEHDLQVRSQDPRFLAAAGTYLKKLGEQLVPLQVTHGGPILMMQVENEYGSFGSDHVYMQKIMDLERAAGFDVPFFTADGGGSMMAGGHLPDALPGLNGGGENTMKEVSVYRPTGPWFVPEFYPGWLDHWGEPHAKIGIGGLVEETEWKISHNVSFCYYMIFGGTSFGFMNGANYGGHFQPQPTSYDYNSPMDEAGRPTPKYFALRGVLAKHIAPGETLPDVPASTPIIAITNIALTESASLFDNLGKPIRSPKPLSFEDLDQGYGYVLYRTHIAEATTNALLQIKELRDYATVYLDGKRVAILDRRHQQDSVTLTNVSENATLDILVENGGRINYGRQLRDNRKGITESVSLGDQELTGWEMYKFPFDDNAVISAMDFRPMSTMAAPAVHRGTFELAQLGDTFLDLRGWEKGIVIVNGHNLGRYWYIGPQQTLYCPGVWLKKGSNEIVVFEQLSDGGTNISGLTTPVLDQLKKDENAPGRGKMVEPKIEAADLIKSGTLADSAEVQDVTFPPKTARYLCLQALSSHNGDDFTTLAELKVLNAAGKAIPSRNWKVTYVDSEENFAEGDPAENAFDGHANTYWHTLWSAPSTPHPHMLVIDLGAKYEIGGVKLLPRQDSDHGRIKDYRLYLREMPFAPLHP